MRIVVVTSGTGKKSTWCQKPLTREDFVGADANVESRHREQQGDLVAAEDLYAGDQHTKLMEGVRYFRERWPAASEHSLDLWIVSPGYGLVGGERLILPYDTSFQGMNRRAIEEWSQAIGIPSAVREVLSAKYDLAFLLLGHAYVLACSLDQLSGLGGPTYVLGGGQAARTLTTSEDLRLVPLGWTEASTFGCLLLAPKGVITSGWLHRLADEPSLAHDLARGEIDPVTGWTRETA